MQLNFYVYFRAQVCLTRCEKDLKVQNQKLPPTGRQLIVKKNNLGSYYCYQKQLDYLNNYVNHQKKVLTLVFAKFLTLLQQRRVDIVGNFKLCST